MIASRIPTGISLPRYWLAYLLLAALVAGCEFPRDADGTEVSVRGSHTLHVGAVNAPPWLETGNGEPSGSDAELIKRLAGQFGATVEWHYGGFEQLRLLLEERQLDLLAGGFEKELAMREPVGVTRSYARIDWWVIGNTGAGMDIDGMDVAVRHGRAAAMVRKAGGRPVLAATAQNGDARLEAVPVSNAETPAGAVRKLGWTEHVFLLPPGESGWLVAVERAIARDRRAMASTAVR